MRQLIEYLQAIHEDTPNLTKEEALASLQRVFGRQPKFKVLCPLPEVQPVWLRRTAVLLLSPLVAFIGLFAGACEFLADWFREVW